mmetsp:Transcript_41648/g.53716  ORF Transcript_41648/g.53716 Transcript_41648/m.53716 type:complete len:112 (+) Transcript_41648:4035-4370(+)
MYWFLFIVVMFFVVKIICLISLNVYIFYFYKYISMLSLYRQFVIISLRNNMFELADRLVGIYKTNDTTKSVTINPKLFSAPEVERLSRQVERADSNPLRNLTNIAAAATTN